MTPCTFLSRCHRAGGWLFCLFAVWGLTLAAADSRELPDSPPLRVGLYVNPPFVMRSGDSCRGMAVDLWTAVAERQRLQCTYTEFPSIAQLLGAARDGDLDVCVSNLAVTAERAELVAFTFPWFDSGLRIAVPVRDHPGVWERLVRNGHTSAYAMLVILFVVVALLVTLLRRWRDDAFTKNWPDGFTTSLKEVISVAKSGELPSQKPNWFRNLMVSSWMIFGMALLAYITSSVTAAMTEASRHRGIAGLSDLPGRNAAVLAGSSAERYLGQLGVHVSPHDNIHVAAQAASAGEAEAVVGDTAVLEYFAVNNRDVPVALVGGLFHKYKFAFGVGRARVELADRISVSLIELDESGVIANIRSRYFGRSDRNDSPGVPTDLFTAPPAQ